MNKATLLFCLFTLLLAACSGESQASPEVGSVLNTDYENALSVEMQLVLGTLALEDTDQAVNTTQAAELLPLWKASRSLGESETVADEEISAIFVQIQETMAAEQVAAIAAMVLSNQDIAAIAEVRGMEFGPGGGGLPGGVGGPGGSAFQDLSPEERATAIAERAERFGMGRRLNPVFLNVIIDFLEARSQ